MKYKVKALDTYSRLNVKDKELNYVPKEGEEFYVSKERLDVLLGSNSYNTAFVKLVPEDKKLQVKKNNKITKRWVKELGNSSITLKDGKQYGEVCG